MAQWQRRIDLRDVWNRGRGNLNAIALVICNNLVEMAPLNEENADELRKELAQDFKNLAADPTATTDDFNDLMEQLYDWGDTRLDENWNGKKVCWIHTTL